MRSPRSAGASARLPLQQLKQLRSAPLSAEIPIQLELDEPPPPYPDGVAWRGVVRTSLTSEVSCARHEIRTKAVLLLVKIFSYLASSPPHLQHYPPDDDDPQDRSSATQKAMGGRLLKRTSEQEESFSHADACMPHAAFPSFPARKRHGVVRPLVLTRVLTASRAVHPLEAQASRSKLPKLRPSAPLAHQLHQLRPRPLHCAAPGAPGGHARASRRENRPA